MKRKRIAALFLALTMALAMAAPALAEEGGDIAIGPASAEDLALAAANTAMQYGGATAMQYAVWSGGESLLSGQLGAYSKTENRTLLDTDLFGIGSISKVYTAAAMMKLVEGGKVDLDAPVTKYLPTFQMEDARYKDITVRMLLNHSSGLMGGSTYDAFLFADTDRTATHDLLARLATQRLKADPGEIAVYCNDGFTLAELVIEAVSGKEFGTFLHESLLAPAGLSNTFVPQDTFDTTRLVKTYATPAETRPLPQDTLGLVGCGGIYSSAKDVAAFGGALTSAGLLTQASLAAMEKAEYKNGVWPTDDADLLAYGLGWDSVKVYPFALDEVQALSKGGDTQFYHAALVVIPAYNLAAAVLSSGGVSVYNQMAAAQMLVAALRDKGVTITETAPTLAEAAPATMPSALTQRSGYYGAFSQQMKVTVSEDGNLTINSLTVPTAPEQVFSYHSDGSFRDATGASLVKLVEEENGETYLYQKAWSNLPGLGLLPTSNYVAQKMDENTLTAEVTAAWNALNTMPTVPVNLKHSNQLYTTFFAQAAAQMAAGLPEYVPGYMGALRIIDATSANNELVVPGTGSRDSQDMTVYEVDGITCYSTNQGIVFADAAKVGHAIYTGAGAYATVQENGWARWYEVAEKDAGKTMTVTLPANSGFYVYDESGTVVASSTLYGDTTAVLPAKGSIVFAGEPGARFYLAFNQA